jgi:cytochrome c2
MKKLLAIYSLILIFTACGGSAGKDDNKNTAPAATTETSSPNGNPSYDPNRGEGKFHDITVSEKLDGTMATKGEKIADLKCTSCHKTTDEKLVGPGWKGVTTRHKPECNDR